MIKMKIERRPRLAKGEVDEKNEQPALVQVKQTTGLLTVVDLAGISALLLNNVFIYKTSDITKILLSCSSGSERIKRSQAEGLRLKEATNINASLLAFGNVVQVCK